MQLPRDSLMTTSRAPMYYRLTLLLLALMTQGAFTSNEQLPPEDVIAEHLHISRPTVRRALDELEQQRSIRRVHGRGTFVN